MCPDRDLISAYVDGEVPSPWRERLEEHLGSCPDCAAAAAAYDRLGGRLRTELALDEDAALDRGRERLDAMLENLPDARFGAAGRGPAPARWNLGRRLSLPLPIAAAAAILAILIGGAASLVAFRPGKEAPARVIASEELAPPPSKQASAQALPASMDELLRYLDERDGQVTLTINLPRGTTFGSAGKPVIMRSVPSLRPPKGATEDLPQSGLPVGGSAP